MFSSLSDIYAQPSSSVWKLLLDLALSAAICTNGRAGVWTAHFIVVLSAQFRSIDIFLRYSFVMSMAGCCRILRQAKLLVLQAVDRKLDI